MEPSRGSSGSPTTALTLPSGLEKPLYHRSARGGNHSYTPPPPPNSSLEAHNVPGRQKWGSNQVKIQKLWGGTAEKQPYITPLSLKCNRLSGRIPEKHPDMPLPQPVATVLV